MVYDSTAVQIAKAMDVATMAHIPRCGFVSKLIRYVKNGHWLEDRNMSELTMNQGAMDAP